LNELQSHSLLATTTSTSLLYFLQFIFENIWINMPDGSLWVSLLKKCVCFWINVSLEHLPFHHISKYYTVSTFHVSALFLWRVYVFPRSLFIVLRSPQKGEEHFTLQIFMSISWQCGHHRIYIATAIFVICVEPPSCFSISQFEER